MLWKNLQIFITEKPQDPDDDITYLLGQYLFTYYLWDIYPLQGERSLLARFYEKTKDDRAYWGKLFSQIGFTLKNSGPHLNEELITRAIGYFEWRLEVAEPLELSNFSYWLEAECLKPEWRLQSYLQILELEFGHKGDHMKIYQEIKALDSLRSGNLPLVVQCFAKTIDSLDSEASIYIPHEYSQPILEDGLLSSDDTTRKYAEQAQAKLLELGHFGYLDT